VALALAWLPGQDRASALRLWLTGGVGLLLLRKRLHPLDMRRARWLVPWSLLLLATLGASAWVGAPRFALRHAVVVGGWLAGLLLGLAEGEAGLVRLGPWWAAAGAVAGLPVALMGGPGTFGNPDYLAALLVGTTLGTVGGWLRVPRPRRRWLAASLAVQAVALVRAQSLGAVAALAVALLAWGWLAAREALRTPGPGRSRLAWRPGALRWLLVGLPLLGLALGGFAVRSPVVREHLRGRAHLARSAWRAVTEVAPWGVGPGQAHGPLLEAQVLVLRARPSDRRFHSNAYHAHNEALQILLEGGVLGALLLLVPLVLAVVRPRPGPAWAGVLAYGALGAVSLPLQMPSAAFVASLFLGAALVRTHRPAAQQQQPAPSGVPTAPRGPWAGPLRHGALAVGVLLLGLATADLLGDRLTAAGRVHGSADTLARAGVLLLHPARAQQLEADARRPGDSYAAYALARRAVQRNPSVQGWMLAGRVAWQDRSLHAALDCFHEAARLHPGLFAAQVNLSRTYEDLGRRAEARRHAANARTLRPTDPRLRTLPPP